MEKDSGKPLEVLVLQDDVENCDGWQIVTLTPPIARSTSSRASSSMFDIDTSETPRERLKASTATKIMVNDLTYENLAKHDDLMITYNNEVFAGRV